MKLIAVIAAHSPASRIKPLLPPSTSVAPRLDKKFFSDLINSLTT